MASVLQAPGFRSDASVFCLNAPVKPDLAWNLHCGGMQRHTYARSRRLITRRSQVQILPPLLRKALETAPFAFCRSFRSTRPFARLLPNGVGLLPAEDIRRVVRARRGPFDRG
jgi:hypothetical protein